MDKQASIRIEGVGLNVEWVKSMTLAQFKKNAQVRHLFGKKLPVEKLTDKFLTSVYEAVTGKKAKEPGGSSDETEKQQDPVEGPGAE